MALSTAERQARYRQRLKDAAQGVTPEMVREAVKVFYHRLMEFQGDQPDWNGWLASCRTKRGANSWLDMVPGERGVDADAYDWIEDEEERALVTKVAAVGRAMKFPPSET